MIACITANALLTVILAVVVAVVLGITIYIGLKGAG